MEHLRAGVWQAHRRLLDDITAGGHRRVDTTRPTMGFPLGTALVLLIVFGVSALFSCCYHWEKFRTLHSRYTGTGFPDPSVSPVQALPLHVDADSSSSKDAIKQCRSLPVLMPGDKMPKFIAWPSPHGFAPSPQANQIKADAQSSTC
uniref:Hydroxyproline-rich glycoprotein family protein n=1 Tax=Picea sitchensis TaxID=3332 RepID=D5A9I8_PICSI|nr:unknown [Picea sitchensis]